MHAALVTEDGNNTGIRRLWEQQWKTFQGRETRIIIQSLLKFRFTVGLKIHKPVVYRSRYNDSLRSGRPGDRIPGQVSVPPPVHTGPVAHVASYKMSAGHFRG